LRPGLEEGLLQLRRDSDDKSITPILFSPARQSNMDSKLVDICHTDSDCRVEAIQLTYELCQH